MDAGAVQWLGDFVLPRCLLLVLSITLIGLPVAACGAPMADQSPRGAPGQSSPGSNVTPAPSPAGGRSAPVSPQAQPAVDAALQAAAGRLGLPRDQLRVVQVNEREWSDASLGCPQPGAMYAQVITPGFLVTVEGAGRRVEVHTDQRGRAVICP
jgi:hypothetical protein